MAGSAEAKTSPESLVTDREGELLDAIEALSQESFAALRARVREVMRAHGENADDERQVAVRVGQAAYGIGAANRAAAARLSARKPGR